MKKYKVRITAEYEFYTKQDALNFAQRKATNATRVTPRAESYSISTFAEDADENPFSCS